MTSPTPEDLRRIREIDEPQDRPPTVREPEPDIEEFRRRERDRDRDRERQPITTPEQLVEQIADPESEIRTSPETGATFEITSDGRVRQILPPQGAQVGVRQFTQSDIGQRVDGGRITRGFRGRFFLLPDDPETLVEEVRITGVGTQLAADGRDLIVLPGGATLPISVPQFQALAEDEQRALLGGRFDEFRRLLRDRLKAEGAVQTDQEADALIDAILEEEAQPVGDPVAAFQTAVDVQVAQLQPTPGVDIRSQIVGIARREATSTGVLLDDAQLSAWSVQASEAVASRSRAEPFEVIGGTVAVRLDPFDPSIEGIEEGPEFRDDEGNRLLQVPDGFVDFEDFEALNTNEKRLVLKFGVGGFNRAKGEQLRLLTAPQVAQVEVDEGEPQQFEFPEPTQAEELFQNLLNRQFTTSIDDLRRISEAGETRGVPPGLILAAPLLPALGVTLADPVPGDEFPVALAIVALVAITTAGLVIQNRDAIRQEISEFTAPPPESLRQPIIRPGPRTDLPAPPSITSFPARGPELPTRTEFPLGEAKPLILTDPLAPPELPQLVTMALDYIEAVESGKKVVVDEAPRGMTEEELEAINDALERAPVGEAFRELNDILERTRERDEAYVRKVRGMLEDAELKRQLLEQARKTFVESGGFAPSPGGDLVAQLATASVSGALASGATPTEAANFTAATIAQTAPTLASITTPDIPAMLPNIPANVVASVPTIFTPTSVVPQVPSAELDVPSITPTGAPSITPTVARVPSDAPTLGTLPQIGTVEGIAPFFGVQPSEAPFVQPAPATGAPADAPSLTTTGEIPLRTTAAVTPTPARISTRPRLPRGGRPPIPEMQPPKEGEEPTRILTTVAWRQVDTWVAVSPPYEVANFRFPASTPTGSRFFASASDALAFVDGRVSLSPKAREFWLRIAELNTEEGLRNIQDRQREIAISSTEDAELRSGINTERSPAQIDLERTAAALNAERSPSITSKAKQRQEVIDEQAPARAEIEQMRAEIEAEVLEMGFKPKPAVQIQRRRGVPVFLGRARQRPVFATATEVDFTDEKRKGGFSVRPTEQN